MVLKTCKAVQTRSANPARQRAGKENLARKQQTHRSFSHGTATVEELLAMVPVFPARACSDQADQERTMCFGASSPTSLPLLCGMHTFVVCLC